MAKRQTKVIRRTVKNRIKKDGTKGSSNWGGRRPGAGRKTDAEFLNIRDQSVKSFRERYDILPLDYAMCIINDIDPRTKEPHSYSSEQKKWAVSIATPYLNARLSSVQLTGADNGPIKYSVDVRKLSEEELLSLERIMSKAAITETENNTDEEPQHVETD
jgi:hypothetical protein